MLSSSWSFSSSNPCSCYWLSTVRVPCDSFQPNRTHWMLHSKPFCPSGLQMKQALLTPSCELYTRNNLPQTIAFNDTIHETGTQQRGDITGFPLWTGSWPPKLYLAHDFHNELTFPQTFPLVSNLTYSHLNTKSGTYVKKGWDFKK